MKLNIGLLLLSSFIPTLVWGANPAADINLLTGTATATTPAAEIRDLKKGDTVFPQEVLSTGPNSYLNLRYSDGSFTLIRPNSRLQIESYAFKADKEQETDAKNKAAPTDKKTTASKIVVTKTGRASSESKATFRLLKGGLRAVTGLIGKLNRDQYSLKTPVATIGIRGTDYTAVICDKACAADPVIRSELTDARVAEGGLIAGVFDGSITVDSDGRNCDKPEETGICVLGSGQFLVVTKDGDQIRLSQAPRFLVVDATPNPLTCAP